MQEPLSIGRIESKDLLYEIFRHLGPKDLARARCTCKVWQHVADEDTLWKRPCLLAYPSLRSREFHDIVNHTIGFKRFYKEAQEQVLCKSKKRQAKGVRGVAPEDKDDPPSQVPDVENPAEREAEPPPQRMLSSQQVALEDLCFFVDVTAGGRHLYSSAFGGKFAGQLISRAPQIGSFSMQLYTPHQAELAYDPMAALLLLIGDLPTAEAILQRPRRARQSMRLQLEENEATPTLTTTESKAWGPMKIEMQEVYAKVQKKGDGQSPREMKDAVHAFARQHLQASWVCFDRKSGRVASLAWHGRSGGCTFLTETGDWTFKASCAALLPPPGWRRDDKGCGVARSEVELVLRLQPDEGLLSITSLRLEICRDNAQEFGSPVGRAEGLEVLSRALRWQSRGTLSASQALLERHTCTIRRHENWQKFRLYAWLSLCHLAIIFNVLIAIMSFWIAIYALITHRLPPQLGLNRLCKTC